MSKPQAGESLTDLLVTDPQNEFITKGNKERNCKVVEKVYCLQRLSGLFQISNLISDRYRVNLLINLWKIRPICLSPLSPNSRNQEARSFNQRVDTHQNPTVKPDQPTQPSTP